MFTLAAALLPLAVLPPLPASDLETIGRRVWQSEAAGQVSGLTSWNTGEDFASLGIGHFIWYPAGPKGPFDESFPTLIAFLKQKGVAVPSWIKPDMACPWNDRASFLKDVDSPKMRELRDFLAGSVAQQSLFLAERLDRALPTLLSSAPSGKRDALRQNFEHLASSAKGRFVLIDYVNFKGEGTKATERYHGEGWGLLQVLETLPPKATPADFSRSAAVILKKRVQNSPPERGEQRWLPGWLNRVNDYAK
jgi:hypothetical protein